MKKFFIALCLVAFTMASCTSSKNACSSKEATKYLTNSLTNFHKVKVELATENQNCNYLFNVKSKEFENGVTYMVTRTKGKWSYTIMSK